MARISWLWHYPFFQLIRTIFETHIVFHIFIAIGLVSFNSEGKGEGGVIKYTPCFSIIYIFPSSPTLCWTIPLSSLSVSLFYHLVSSDSLWVHNATLLLNTYFLMQFIYPLHICGTIISGNGILLYVRPWILVHWAHHSFWYSPKENMYWIFKTMS